MSKSKILIEYLKEKVKQGEELLRASEVKATRAISLRRLNISGNFNSLREEVCRETDGYKNTLKLIEVLGV